MRDDLRPDCANCFALCCVALRLTRSPDFAIEKPAGVPCPNLAPDLLCTIHSELAESGFGGCAAYDCQGAGQKVSQITFGGRDWRTDDTTARWMLVVYPVVRQLHELLARLVDALDAATTEPTRRAFQSAYDEIEALTLLPPEELVRLDVRAHRDRIRRLVEGPVNSSAGSPRSAHEA